MTEACGTDVLRIALDGCGNGFGVFWSEAGNPE